MRLLGLLWTDELDGERYFESVLLYCEDSVVTFKGCDCCFTACGQPGLSERCVQIFDNVDCHVKYYVSGDFHSSFGIGRIDEYVRWQHWWIGRITGIPSNCVGYIRFYNMKENLVAFLQTCILKSEMLRYLMFVTYLMTLLLWCNELPLRRDIIMGRYDTVERVLVMTLNVIGLMYVLYYCEWYC